ncbi:right-handed parallel beta-helix repeat-containing protein [Flavobacterium lacus]|uniref:Pectate lyase-like protein n=1 Tax=Flavobacterium lacus TaxID=1353778 RepID=A0A328WXP6_9FLAO|nr:hypothetical protein [Flavobacterium lacus]RAR51061.1 hypothetical protein B0I10_101235 [Flavobacterium lacus]
MKKLITLLTILFISSTFAQQRLIAIKGAVTDTIANTLEQAIEIAQTGDKIYLPGGYFTHTPVITKQVHIIGTGFQDGQNVTGKTTISGNLTLGAGANGSTFEGFYLTEYFIPTVAIENITIKRCNMLGVPPYYSTINNSYFINCVVRENLHLGTYELGQGNYVLNSIVPYIAYTKNSTIKNCIISNSIGALDNVTVQDNIFGKTSDCLLLSVSSNITFVNNIIPQTCLTGYSDSGIISEANLIGFGTINTLFVNATDFSFNPLFNFQLLPSILATSPNAASCGIFSGDYPWKVGSLPIIPNIEQNNSYLDAQNQTFKLNVKVVPQTH